MNLVKREANDYDKLSMVKFKIWKLERDLERDFISQKTIDSINTLLRKFRIDRDVLMARISDSKRSR